LRQVRLPRILNITTNMKWFTKNKDGIIAGVIGSIFSSILFVYLLQPLFLRARLLLGDKSNLVLSFIVKLLTISLPIYILITLIIAFIISLRLVEFVKTNRKGLKIVKAIYASNRNSFNITRELNNAIQGDKLLIILSNNIAGDPDYGVTKTGTVKYRYNGKIEEKKYREGEVISLP